LGVRMLAKPQPPRILLPKGWQGCVKLAVLYAIALAQGLPRFIGYYSIVYVRAWAAEREGLSCAVLASPCSNVNDFVLSLLPELGTMGSKRGGVGVTRSSTS